MKAVFLGILGLLLSVAIVRFSFGLAPNEVSYVVQTLLSLPPDVREEFGVVIVAFEQFRSALSTLNPVVVGQSDILDVIKNFFAAIGAFVNVPLTFVGFLVQLVGDFLNVFQALFGLLLGQAVSPIVP